MNEIDVLQAFRAAAAAPDSTVELRARRALLRQAIAPQAAARRSGGRRRFAVLAVAAAAAAAAVIAVPTLPLGGHPATATASAADVLNQAGRAAAAADGTGWADAPFWHAASRYQQGSGPVLRREIWVGHERPGALFDEGVGQQIRALEAGRFDIGYRSLSWDELYALPTDPAELEARLRSGPDGIDSDSQLFHVAATMLQETPAPPALRRALFQMAAAIPGVASSGEQTDSAGRVGVALRMGHAAYLVDPRSGEFLEYTKDGTVTPGQGTPCGTRYRVTYQQQGPANDAPHPTRRTSGPGHGACG
jgi:hypothetical protein